MPQNGDQNKKFGVYKSLCCSAEIVINVGSIFPDCPNHRKLTTAWKLIPNEKIIQPSGAQKSESDPAGTHIENRHLFEMASGRIKLQEAEQQHLQGCSLCESILSVFLNQTTSAPNENHAKLPDAA